MLISSWKRYRPTNKIIAKSVKSDNRYTMWKLSTQCPNVVLVKREFVCYSVVWSWPDEIWRTLTRIAHKPRSRTLFHPWLGLSFPSLSVRQNVLSSINWWSKLRKILRRYVRYLHGGGRFTAISCFGHTFNGLRFVMNANKKAVVHDFKAFQNLKSNS